jgi:hypothetical protein
MPAFSRLCLKWILKKLQSGHGRISARRVLEIKAPVFKADAKAEGDLVVLGGWRCDEGQSKAEARWYSVVLNPQNAWWAFSKGAPFKVTVSLEILARLFNVMHLADENEFGKCEVRVPGVTDNQGNSYVVRKLLTTRFPLNVLLMELSEQMERRSLWMSLTWVRRDDHQEADDLTNHKFEGFAPERRIEIDMSKVPWILLDEFMQEGFKLYKDLEVKRSEERSLRLKRPAWAWKQEKSKRRRLATTRLKWTDPW